MPRNDAWKIIGPGAGGAHYIPTISPFDDRMALVACDMTGAYLTRDGGKSWREFNLRGRVHAFAFDFRCDGVLFAASNGIYRSVDHGERWTLVHPKPDTIQEERKIGDHSGSFFVTSAPMSFSSYMAVYADPDDGRRVYAAARPDGRGSETHILASRDGGDAFEEIAVIDARSCFAIAVDAAGAKGEDDRRVIIAADTGLHIIGDGAVAIARPDGGAAITAAAFGRDALGASVGYIITAGRMDGAVYTSGLWRYRSGAWDALIPFAEDAADFTPELLPEYVKVTTSPLDASRVYVGLHRYPYIDPDDAEGSVTRLYGILSSDDGGASFAWKLRATHYRDAENRELGWNETDYSGKWNWIGPKGSEPLGMGMAPRNPDVCLVTDLATSYQTRDGGLTWRPCYQDRLPDGSTTTRGTDVTTCYGVHFDPFDPKHIAISYTDIGLWHSKNGGAGWLHSMKNIPVSYGNTCYWLVFDPEIRGRVWSVWGGGHDLPRPKMFRSGQYFRFEGAVCKSDDGMESWREATGGIPENSVMTHIVLDPSSPAGKRTLYAAAFGRGVYRSDDDGETWALKDAGMRGNGNRNVFRLTLLPDGRLYAVVARGWRRGQEVDGALYLSRDSAETWTRVPLPDRCNDPNAIAFDPGDPNRLYLSCWPQTVDGREYGGGVFAGDGAHAWRQIFREDAHVYGLAVDPDDCGHLYLCGFDHGAYRSTDRGGTWQRLKGFNFHWGHLPVLDPHDRGRIYLTTFGSSVWHGPRAGDPDAFEDVYPIPNAWDPA